MQQGHRDAGEDLVPQPLELDGGRLEILALGLLDDRVDDVGLTPGPDLGPHGFPDRRFFLFLRLLFRLRELLLDRVAGLPIPDAQAILEGLGAATVNVWPGFIGDLPDDRQRITLDVEEPSTTE